MIITIIVIVIVITIFVLIIIIVIIIVIIFRCFNELLFDLSRELQVCLDHLESSVAISIQK